MGIDEVITLCVQEEDRMSRIGSERAHLAIAPRNKTTIRSSKTIGDRIIVTLTTHRVPRMARTKRLKAGVLSLL